MHYTTISLKNIISMCSAALILWGCGNSDDSSTKPSLIINEAESFDDLPNCSPNREGDTAKVVNDTAVYICQNGRWSVKDFATYESEDDLPNCTVNREGNQAFVTETGEQKVCSNKQWISLKDYSNANSNGNKKNDTSSNSENSDSSVTSSSSSFGNSNSSYSLEADSSVNNGSNNNQETKFEPISKPVTGFSQVATSISVMELDAKTLAQTGKVFKGSFLNENGEFSIPNISVESPYVLFEATGDLNTYNLDQPITLYALVDISTRDNVNINLLTHLAYERTVYLINSGIGFHKAKKQAENELARAFYFDEDNIPFEDLTIFGESAGTAKLLAANLIALLASSYSNYEYIWVIWDSGESPQKKLTFLNQFIRDFREDGEWNDESNKEMLANLFYGGRFSLNYNPSIYSDQYTNNTKHFWESYYKLGTCDNLHEGEKVLSPDTSDHHKKSFVCRDGKWKETYAFCEYGLSKDCLEKTFGTWELVGVEDTETGSIIIDYRDRTSCKSNPTISCPTLYFRNNTILSYDVQMLNGGGDYSIEGKTLIITYNDYRYVDVVDILEPTITIDGDSARMKINKLWLTQKNDFKIQYDRFVNFDDSNPSLIEVYAARITDPN